MLGGGKVLLPSGGLRRLVKGPFEPGRKPYVGHLPACPADEMVVVGSRELLGELETPVVICSRDAPNGTRFDQGRDVAIRTALRQAGVALKNLGNGQRSAGSGHALDQGTSKRRVALIEHAETTCDLIVDSR